MKQLLLSALLLGPAVAASAAVAPPDELYLVGTMNGWMTPADGGTEFKLMPDGGSGLTYHGSFDFSGLDQMEFKVFTGVYGWTDTEGYLSVKTNIFSFKDMPDVLPMGLDANGFWSNVVISNWQPGNLDITVTLQETDGKFISGEITLVSDTQPEFPKSPDTVYIVGAFNDYQLPTATETNGAIVLPRVSSEDELPVYRCQPVEIPADKARFILYYIDPNTEKGMYINGPEESFSMLAPAEGEPAIRALYTPSSAENNGNYFDVDNYTGGTMAFYYALFENFVQFAWYEAPLSELMSTTLYMVVETDNGPQLIEPLYDTYYQLDNPMEVKSLYFTSEKTTEPSAESIWGVVEDLTQSSDFGRYTVVKGGKPLTLNFAGKASLLVMLNKNEQIFDVNATIIVDVTKLEKIYLVGYMNNWMTPNEANAEQFEAYSLHAVEPGVFEGSFLCPANKDYAGFRFYYALSGWDTSSLGASAHDFSDPTPVEFKADMPIYTGNGKGNWILSDWTEDARLSFQVDLNSYILVVTEDDGSIVNVIDATPAEAQYFTLQGVRTANPANGVYIKMTSGKTEKVYLK